jgi:hypothetical protein
MALPSLSAQQFRDKWLNATLKERSGSQEHFIDLCHLVGHPTPGEAHQDEIELVFEAGAIKPGGGQGWADVWKRDYFAWDYKGKHKDLDAAYQQLLQYHESLDHPPLLVVSDMEQIIVYTKFVNAPRRKTVIELDDLFSTLAISMHSPPQGQA